MPPMTPPPGKTCASCGATGQEGAFCAECGQTLPEAAPAPPVFSPASVPPPASAPAPAAPPAAVNEPGRPGDVARSLIVPVEEPSRPAPAAAPVLPGRPEPARPREVKLQEAGDAGAGPPCPWCGTPNPVGRHFCRRCAMSLEKSPEDAVPARRSWWRRMTDRENQPIPYAGQRPRLRRGPGQAVRLLAGLLAVVLIVILAGIFGPGAVGAIEDHFATPHFEQVASVTGNTDGITNGPSNLTDQWSNTWWGTGGTVGGAYLDVTFASPVHLLDVIITPGAGATGQEFQTQDSPTSLTFTMTGTGRRQTTQVIHLNGSFGAQAFALRASDVTKIHIVVGAAFPSGNPAGGGDQQIAVSGIEFFGR